MQKSWKYSSNIKVIDRSSGGSSPIKNRKTINEIRDELLMNSNYNKSKL